jgi:RimJ/RimL family protein N-acetyltransferase
MRLSSNVRPHTNSAVESRLTFEPLTVGHAQELGAVLLNEQVYQHIGGTPPSPERFKVGIQRVLAGPPAHRSGDEWINYVVRQSQNNAVVGRLEATTHDGIAEVAFLFGPKYWGKGYATEGLLWLHKLLLARSDCRELWATTVPANSRCQALLARCGYSLVHAERPARLVSYDDGDLVFRGPSAA